MNTQFKALAFSLLFAASFAQGTQSGGVTVGGTRLIYDGSKKEASLSVTNSDSSPYLIQSWVETQENGIEKAPFIVTPPLFRLEANQRNVLRIVYADSTLAQDRESLYWLNVKSIPSDSARKDANTLQIAVKTRIKLIYRPKNLKGVPEEVTSKITWSQSGQRLTVTNPTPFVMNFQQVKLGNQEVKDATFVLPMSSATFTAPAAATGPISWKLINDYGGIGPEHGTKS